MYTLYYSPGAASLVVHWLLIEIGAKHELRKLDLAAGEHKRADYLALNPNGTVPAIDDDGLVLFESLAITLHLARTRPEGGLWAASAAGPSQILQWTLWAATEIEPLARQWYRQGRQA